MNSLRQPKFLVILVTLIFASTVQAKSVPTFLLLKENSPRKDVLSAIEKAGGQVTLEALPALIVNLPETVNAAALPHVKQVYTDGITATSLTPYGSLAMAAGLHWNRSLIGNARGMNAQSFSSLSSRISRLSLAPPTNLLGRVENNRLVFEWTPVAGTILYQLQFSDRSNFSTILFQTKTDRTKIEAPLLKAGALYARIRALDRQDMNQTSQDWTGQWSNTIQLTGSAPALETLPAPQLTSPANNLETDGMTVVLEWTATNGVPARVQISEYVDFSEVIVDELVSVAEFSAAPSLFKTGQAVYWRVQSNGAQTSPWSSARSFKIGEPRHHATDVFINPEAPQ